LPFAPIRSGGWSPSFLLLLRRAVFLQAYFHFCAHFGMRGLYNVAKGVGQTDTIMQAEFRKQDQRKAWRIIGLSVLIGVFVSGLAYVMPL